MAETGLIRKIAFAAESTAAPTMPAAGANIDWTYRQR